MTNACGDKKRLGQQCGSTGDCLTGDFCVDGFCCGAASCPTCYSCGVSGREGACTAVPESDPEPHDRCAAAPPCGFTGKCDGVGACAFAPVSTACGTASCTGSMLTPVGNCDGAGACDQAPMSCGDYVCGSGACLTTCSGDGDCVSGETCQGSSCTSLLPDGQSCVMDADCISTHCAQGICCDQPCGGCQSCALPGAVGTCTPVAAGTDPAGACAAGCVDATILGLASTCDGAGACVPMTMDCSPFACNGAACLTMCNGPADCAAGASCTSGACVP
jgi:hypothetical protein